MMTDILAVTVQRLQGGYTVVPLSCLAESIISCRPAWYGLLLINAVSASSKEHFHVLDS